MSGPRDLRRGRKPFEQPATTTELVGGKSHYIVRRNAIGYVIIINRRGQMPTIEHCGSEGEMRRAIRRLSDDGLIGVNEVDR